MIVVTGTGCLSQELVKRSTEALPIEALSRQDMDITNEKQVWAVIGERAAGPNPPRYVVHTAALTKPMQINDDDPMLSLETNIVGTANVVKACYQHKLKLIYISTDFVYPPSQKSNEESGVVPQNKYAWSKLGGECAVQLLDDHLILRCALCDIPFRHKVAFNDVFRNSILHSQVAELILKLKDEIGAINIGGDYTSVYEFVSQFETIETRSGKEIVPSLELDISKLTIKLRA
ncbi:MAG: hypothetical protein COB66_01685 [Coxiella sp. (in: Bacteria)]|nr:MAG: hypothetical protein COB66_01685 [Coxiella sp. (in: g-proteobacteria)]